MFPARAVLGDQAWPVPGAAGNLNAALVLLDADLVVGADRGHGPSALLYEARPCVRARDTELPYVLVPRARPANAAVTEVETKQVCVVSLRLGERGWISASRTDSPWVSASGMLAPSSQCRAIYSS